MTRGTGSQVGAAESRPHAAPATRIQNEFLAKVSHELRTPLNVILLYSELLQEEAKEEGHERSVADLERIQASGERVLELIDGIVDLSKIEIGTMLVTRRWPRLIGA